jgi:MFS family permease
MSDNSANRQDPGSPSNRYSWYVVGVLLLAYTVAFVDRQILSLLVQPIRRDLGISDTQIGLLAGFAFALFYSMLGVPIAKLADRSSRRAIISIGVALWSLMTALCGLSKNFFQLFLARVGVGVGEATLSPAAYSMMADYFPPHKLGKAISVYAMGLYGGAGLAMLAGSAVVSMVSTAGPVELPLVGTVFAWQLTFFVVALPGLLVLALMATVKEPARRNATGALALKPRAVPLREVFGFMRDNRKIIIGHFGGFLALGTVISAYLVWTPEFLRRSHDFSITEAGFIFGILLLVFGMAGPYAGGWLAEKFTSRGYKDGEMRSALVGGLAMIPLTILTPLVPGNFSVVCMLALATFALSFPQGMAPTILQLIAPNRMRAQLTAVFMFIAVLAGYTIGPAFVAMTTDYVFHDDKALRYSLAIVSAVLTPVGVLFLWYGLKPFADRPVAE